MPAAIGRGGPDAVFLQIPGLVINGEVKIAGKVTGPDEIQKLVV